LALAAISLALMVPGCGGGSTNSSGTELQPTIAPAPAASSSAESQRRRHHHRARKGEGTVALGAAGAATGAQAAPSSGSWPCDDAQFLQDQRQFASGALQGDQEVDVCGSVTTVLAARDTRSGLHGYYALQVAPGDTILIVCDLGEMDAPDWPWVKLGDYSYVQGRYYYDSASSQGIDWTHHGTSRSWSTPGYVVVAGTEYQ
jgi:hypothetical protein